MCFLPFLRRTASATLSCYAKRQKIRFCEFSTFLVCPALFDYHIWILFFLPAKLRLWDTSYFFYAPISCSRNHIPSFLILLYHGHAPPDRLLPASEVILPIFLPIVKAVSRHPHLPSSVEKRNFLLLIANTLFFKKFVLC